MSKRDRWDKTGRNPDKVISEIRRTARERDLELIERQTGSHWIGKVPGRGAVVVPVHGEIPKGTWSSIKRMLKLLGLAVFMAFICYLTYSVLVVDSFFGG